MKKVLLASTALVLSAGVAAADVTVSGDGRMGIKQNFGGKAGFTSRIRIAFSASGETDGGLSFGGSIRADNSSNVSIQDDQGRSPGDPGFDPNTISLSGGGVTGQAGSVFIEGGFGKISMGDVDGAARAAVGHVSGVGLTGLSDNNEFSYVANTGGVDPSVLYEYSGGAFGIYLSASNPSNVGNTATADVAYAIGGDYSFGNWSIAAGYEKNPSFTSGALGATDADVDHFIAAVTGSFGAFTGKFGFGQANVGGGGGSFNQWAVSGDYTTGATTLTAFYTDGLTDDKFYGIGVAYDLGGGASVKAGYSQDDTANEGAWDLGLSFSF